MLQVSGSEWSRCPTVSDRQERNLATCNQSEVVLGTLPSYIKHATQSHFTPQHLPADPERYTYSSLSENVYGEKLSTGENKFSGEIVPFVSYLFLGKCQQWGWCSAWIWCAWENWKEPWLYKNPRARRFCHLGACLYDWAGKQIYREGSETKGKWEGGSFSCWCTQSLLQLQGQKLRQNVITERKDPTSNPISAAPGRILFLRGHRHRTEDAFQESPKNAHHQHACWCQDTKWKFQNEKLTVYKTQYYINFLNYSTWYPWNFYYVWKQLVDPFTSRNS